MVARRSFAVVSADRMSVLLMEEQQQQWHLQEQQHGELKVAATTVRNTANLKSDYDSDFNSRYSIGSNNTYRSSESGSSCRLSIVSEPNDGQVMTEMPSPILRSSTRKSIGMDARKQQKQQQQQQQQHENTRRRRSSRLSLSPVKDRLKSRRISMRDSAVAAVAETSSSPAYYASAARTTTIVSRNSNSSSRRSSAWGYYDNNKNSSMDESARRCDDSYRSVSTAAAKSIVEEHLDDVKEEKQQEGKESEEDIASRDASAWTPMGQQEHYQQQQQTIEISPGVKLPLRKAADTWQAILEGHVTVVQCLCCSTDLTCSQDDAVVLCADCWVFNPVPQNDDNDDSDKKNRTVAIGVKTEVQRQWLS